MRRRTQEPFTVISPKGAERPNYRRWAVAGYATLAVFFGAALAWGGFAPLESAAIAVGTVSVDTNKKAVQHLEGGIVAKILVREGDEVKQDQVLIRLDTTQAKSRLDLLKARLVSLEAQLKLTEDELDTVEKLFKKGQSTKPRLLALQRKKAELEGQIAENKAQQRVAEDTMARAEIKAPIAGTVIDMKVHTAGGVIKAGDTLMSIVPKDDKLFVDAQIDPNDIDVVRPGLAAHVRLTPYNARFAPPIPGKVTHVSADRFTDQRTNAAYYQARIELTKAPSEIDKSMKLYPGMPAEVIIVTGERTMLAYLFSPITRSFRRAFREE
jgi:RND family efflux transporter MFP subunit